MRGPRVHKQHGKHVSSTNELATTHLVMKTQLLDTSISRSSTCNFLLPTGSSWLPHAFLPMLGAKARPGGPQRRSAPDRQGWWRTWAQDVGGSCAEGAPLGSPPRWAPLQHLCGVCQPGRPNKTQVAAGHSRTAFLLTDVLYLDVSGLLFPQVTFLVCALSLQHISFKTTSVSTSHGTGKRNMPISWGDWKMIEG